MDLEKVKKLNIPKTPGSYQFYDEDGKIIYVGKAANLNSRVLSYWQKSTDHSPAKYAMLKKVKEIKWIETDSEIEALLLESNLIKKYQPDFNVIMRDDKRYAYIKISTEEDWPKVFITRKLDKMGRYFGPFVSAEAVRETLKIIRKIWPYRSCATMPKRVCLYYSIGKCPGVCQEKISKQEYKKIIKHIILFLEGKKSEVVKEIESEIKDCEKRGDEKNANHLKYQLINLKKVLEHSNILSLIDKYASDVVELAKTLDLPQIPERIEGYDISNIFGQQAVGSMVVFSGGEPNKNEYRKFKIKIGQGEASDVRMLREVLERRLKRSLEGEKEKWLLPDLIIVDGGKGQLSAAVSVLKKNQLNIPIISISKGEGLRSAQAPDKIFFPEQKTPLELSLASPALHIIKRVRDEAHRFAIKYHKELRAKKFFT